MIELIDILKHNRKHNSKSEHVFLTHLRGWLKDLKEQCPHPVSTWEDDCGNIWVHTAAISDAPYLFVAHVDTVHGADDVPEVIVDKHGYARLHEHAYASCLGADDGVGIYANLKMIEAGVEGTFLFTRGEEGGCVGANFIVEKHLPLLERFLLCVEVDRCGKRDIIIEQVTGRTASDKFGKALAKALDMGHEVSYDGIFTDNALFNCAIPECVNVAAGYDRQHTSKERVKLEYVDTLIEKLITLDWAELPIERQTWETESQYDYPDWWNHYDHGLGTTMDKAMTYHEALNLVVDSPQEVAMYLYGKGISAREVQEESINGERFI